MKNLVRSLKSVFRRINPVHHIRRLSFRLRNRLRRRAKIDYVLFHLPSVIPALSETRGFLQRRILGKPPLSLDELDRHFHQIAADPRPKGVILYLRGFDMPLADLQTLRKSISQLRSQGKRVICFAQEYDLLSYYVASVADQILLQTGGMILTLGLGQSAVFLKDTLAQLGISFDVVAITPYKGAMDQLSRDMPSPEGREQLNRLLDSRYQMILEGIAHGRNQTVEQIRTMIDQAPYTDLTGAAFVDGVLNEETLVSHLQSKYVLPWEEAQRALLRVWQQPHPKYVALLTLTGLITNGESRSAPPIPLPIPLLEEDITGDLTFVRRVRQLIEDDRAAAVLFYIDSGGGSATASEAMTAALEELAKTRPLVVYMNNVAASGGYYVATPAHWIIAQPGTITGSIGVVTAKVLLGGFLEKIHAHQYDFYRGANANLMSPYTPLTEAQYQMMRAMIERIYDQFIQRVAKSRKMSAEQVDLLGGGRVWTGREAKQHGLIDALGDLQVALQKARELAKLPDTVPLIMPQWEDKPLSAKVAENVAFAPNAVIDRVQFLTKNTFNGHAQLLIPFFLE
ncbi:MAG: signal peptide peptidase SppA [Anaerolineae bacterium]|jgi:protease-4|nr:signal peptide peptidase SppA [Anaerolineae bacterium]